MKIVRFKDIELGMCAYGVIKEGLIHRLKQSPFDQLEIDRSKTPISYDESLLCPPCEPSKIVALAINYKGATGHSGKMTEPLVFLKGTNSVVGPNQKVRLPFDSNTWGEAELGVVIGKTGYNIERSEAGDYILGYISANDVSCDNIESRDHHLARSKSADGFCPLGHYIDTDYQPENKIIRSFHNDILIRQGNTGDMVWDVKETVCRLSSWMTLYPRDVILTGTPPRVRDRLYLKHGDTYTVDIEGFPNLVTEFYSD